MNAENWLAFCALKAITQFRTINITIISLLILFLLLFFSTVGQNNLVYRLKYWATRSFARTAHSFACSAVLALLARSASLTHSLARSLRSLPHSWDSGWLDGNLLYLFSILAHSGIQTITWHLARPYLGNLGALLSLKVLGRRNLTAVRTFFTRVPKRPEEEEKRVPKHEIRKNKTKHEDNNNFQ